MRKARIDIVSAGLLAGSGGVALAEVASAAVPVLAGGALLLGNGAMVFNAMQQLKELSSEKKELLRLQAKGETHTDRVLEQMDARTKKPGADGDKMVSVPIDLRLKEIDAQSMSTRTRTALIAGGATGMVATALSAPLWVSGLGIRLYLVGLVCCCVAACG